MRNRSHFQTGYGLRGSTFTCSTCGHNTRSTGDNDFTCPICYELCGLANSLSDYGPEDWMAPERDRLVKRVKGDRLAKMRADSWLAPLFELERR